MVPEGLSKNRYKHIHVRFSPAIHGLTFLDSPSGTNSHTTEHAVLTALY